jgi:hypothetical protein
LGYSCGTAELDEMLNTVLMSEIFHRNGFATERTLAVIEFDDGTAIGVRAAPNLIRPAHIFRYLKQGRHAELKASLDYFLDRQAENASGISHRRARRARKRDCPPFSRALAERYRRALTCIARVVRHARRRLRGRIHLQLAGVGRRQHAGQRGDPRLRLDPPVRAKHDKYRYDDVDRFSSTLTEQRHWARELVKVFAQAMHFARTGRS